MLRYLRLEIVRTFRDRRFVFFTLAFPVTLYLLWTNVFADTGTEPDTGLGLDAYMLVAFGIYGAVGATLSVTAPRLAQELQTGWLRQLRVTPLRPVTLVVGKTLAAMTLALPSLILVGLTAVLTQGVRLSPGEWVLLLAIGWLGTLPFAALGMLIGSLVGGDSAQPAMLIVYLGLSIIGGLWMPVSQLPSALRAIAGWTPTNRLAELCWDVVGGHAPSTTPALILAAWAVVLGGLATFAYRRATVQS
jgi:ABC-2 type transport system permease protein